MLASEHIDFSQGFNNPELQFAYWLFAVYQSHKMVTFG
jgi:hypothetical protein